MTHAFILCFVLFNGDVEMCLPVVSLEACLNAEQSIDVRYVEYSRCDSYHIVEIK